LLGATVLVAVAIGCGGGSSSSSSSGTPTSPAVAKASLAVTSLTVQGVRTLTGYQYTVAIAVKESGGVALTVSSADFTLTAGGASIGAVQIDNAFASKVAATGSATSRSITISDDVVGHPYATKIDARLSFADDNSNAGSTTSSVDIPALPAVPTVSVLSLDRTSMTVGQSALLSWSVTNALSVEIDNGIGAVAASGSRSVSPAANTTYQLTATNGGGSTTRSVAVTVTGVSLPPAPTVSSFSIDRSSINIGDSVTLQWSVSSSATSVSIDNGVGSVSTSGSRTVTPLGSTTYTLSCSNAGGSANRSVSVSTAIPSGICAASTVSAGTTAVCNDGTQSQSQNRSGTCSSHGGVRCWVCPGKLCSG